MSGSNLRQRASKSQNQAHRHVDSDGDHTMPLRNANTNPAQSYNERTAAFLADFRQPQTRKRLEALMKLTKAKCEEILEGLAVKGVVTGRTKRPASLEQKLRDMSSDPDFQNWVVSSQNRDIADHHEMGDLAGVRIGLYLPGDIPRVAREVERVFRRRHLFGTVTGGREAATTVRNLDVDRHGDGPWRSRAPDGSDEHWEHYGYKSWQLVCEWGEAPAAAGSFKTVEIQVGTVVTQAWGEVQHDIIYKRHDTATNAHTHGLSSSATTTGAPAGARIIDAVNGLAITTDIMLRELERTAEHAKLEQRRRDARPFRDRAELAHWFQDKCMSPEARRAVASRPDEEGSRMVREAGEFLDFWNRSQRGGGKDKPLCPAILKRLVKDTGVLDRHGEPGADNAEVGVFEALLDHFAGIGTSRSW